jgi:hypothetical protein
MLSEDIGGKCPCCNYDKMFQRHGSLGYYLLDGCPNCGFGYGSNHHDSDCFGIDAWIGYGAHVLASVLSSSIEGEFMLNDEIPDINGSIQYKVLNDELLKLNKDVLRKRIFDWMETQNPFLKSEETVFQYDHVDVERWLETNPVIFKKIEDVKGDKEIQRLTV